MEDGHALILIKDRVCLLVTHRVLARGVPGVEHGDAAFVLALFGFLLGAGLLDL